MDDHRSAGWTLRTGRRVAEAPRIWSAEALGRATDAWVDTGACLLAGADDEATRAVRAAVAPWGRGRCYAAGAPHRLAAPWAALINGTAAHALDYDDVLEVANAHASAALVPALLALGEERGADGARCLDAFLVGLDVMAALGEALNMTHYFKGWHTTLTLGVPAAAAACARLLGLDAGRASCAIGIAASLASGGKIQFGTMTKPLHAGLAAKNGVLAAALAESGVTAAPDAYEGPRGFTALFADLPGDCLEEGAADPSAPAAIERHGLWQKFYPCCASAHRPLDALLALRSRHGLGPADVAEIDAQLPEVAAQNLTYDDPRDAMQARFSLHYLLASALADGRLALDAFTDAALARPQVRALLGRIRMRADPAQPGAANVDAAPHRATVALRLAAGGEWRETVRDPRGHPGRPLSRDELREKFAACAARSLAPAAGDAAFEALAGLASAPDLETVTRRL